MKKNGLVVTKEQNVLLWGLDFIKNASNRKIWFLALTFSSLSFVISFYSGEPNFFSASGGVITIIGLIIFVAISTPVSLEEIDSIVNNQILRRPQIKDDNDSKVIQYIVNVVDETIHDRSRQVLGLSVTIYGTLIWAYGWCIEFVPYFPSSY
jgi:hypothetical protein